MHYFSSKMVFFSTINNISDIVSDSIVAHCLLLHGLLFQALAAHFDRDDEAGPGYSEFFSRAAGDKRARADSLICYQVNRALLLTLT